MKKTLLLSVLMVMMPLMANAYDAEIDGIYYNFSGNEATVTYRDCQYGNYSGSVMIPESVTYNGKTYSVTGINGWAFAYCSDLNSITIPNSVTSIGDFAFNLCRVLTSVIIPDGVKSIGYQTFGHCLALTSVIIPNSVTSIGVRAFDNCGSLQSATIPNSVTEIGERAFEGCSCLTSVTIPDGVRNISDRSFFGCTNLTSLIIGNGVTSIGVSAFAGCQLTSLVIPNSVTSIGDFAFANCSELTSVTFPNGVTSIGHQAFETCVNLTSLTIPSSVTFIANDAFFGCNGLKSFVIDKGNTIYDSRDNCNAIIETGSNTLIWGCMNTTIPSSVTTIGNYAFHGCEGLTSANIPEGVTTIGEGAFQNCNNLTTITIPRSVTVIKDYAFDVFGKLNDVYCYAEEVPNTSIEAFYALTTGFSNPYFAVESATLHVPAVSIDKYKATEPWQYFGNIVAIASDIQHSGCLNRTRASSISTIQSISLLKEGNILTVNLQNYWSTCDTQDFEVTPSVSDGNNGDPYTVSVRVKAIGEDIADCICPYNISFTVHDVDANSFYFKCWWFNGQVNLTDGEPLVLSNEYYPEGTKWTEIRLDTLKYDSWYSKVGDEWVPNFETVEYYVKGTYPYFSETFGDNSLKCVYSNSQEWTDSLSLLIHEGIINEYDNYERGVMATVPVYFNYWDVPFPASAYNFDWRVGMAINFIDILSTNVDLNPDISDFGIIEEIKEGNFGGVRPLKYTDVNGVRIIRGIGVTTWNDGECIFGPVRPYRALSFFNEDFPHKERHYRSMLVHFERNGEVLYDVWPLKGSTVEVTIDNLNYFLDLKTHEAIITTDHTCSGEVDIPSEVNYNRETFVVKSMLWCSFCNNKEITKVSIPKTLVNILHYYPYDPDLQDPPTGMVSSDHMNPFIGCTTLESIEVDEENTSFKSVDGVLFSQDGVGQYYYKTNNYSGTGLYCYPAGAQQESYTIPDGVEWIGSEAFSHNQFISTLTIPNSTKQICGNAFQGCSKLTDVYCYANNVPVAFTNAFDNFPIASATLHVPAASVDKYKATKPWSNCDNIVAMNSENLVTFTQGQIATIILPTMPDASKGKYYRLDRCEDGKIIFEEELNPKARTPYIIVPYDDFSIDLNTLDLAGLSQDTVSIDGISFIGSYTSERLESKEGWYVDIIDTTPDCSLFPLGETEKGAFLIGSLRAFLQVSWDDPYHQGGTKGREEKLEIVLEDNSNGIAEMNNDKVKSEKYDNTIYDLSGRKLFNGQSSMVNGLKKGIYIQNGKVMVK